MKYIKKWPWRCCCWLAYTPYNHSQNAKLNKLLRNFAFYQSEVLHSLRLWNREKLSWYVIAESVLVHSKIYFDKFCKAISFIFAYKVIEFSGHMSFLLFIFKFHHSYHDSQEIYLWINNTCSRKLKDSKSFFILY